VWVGNNLDNSSSLVTKVANTNFSRGAAASVWQSLIGKGQTTSLGCGSTRKRWSSSTNLMSHSFFDTILREKRRQDDRLRHKFGFSTHEHRQFSTSQLSSAFYVRHRFQIKSTLYYAERRLE
jgi:hypothetical protein